MEVGYPLMDGVCFSFPRGMGEGFIISPLRKKLFCTFSAFCFKFEGGGWEQIVIQAHVWQRLNQLLSRN